MNMTDFSACCLAKVDREDGHTRLTVCCVRRDSEGRRMVHKREFNLDPLIAKIRGMLAQEHARLHGTESVSGSWDMLIAKAEQTARRVGESRLIRELFGEVSPLLASDGESDSDSDNAGDSSDNRIYKLLTCARAGNERCLATIGSIVNAAYRGNEAALTACRKLRRLHLALEGKEAARVANVSTAGMTTPELVDIGSWWGSFKKIAKKAGKVATAPIWAPTYLAVKAVDKVPGLRNLNRINPAAWAVHAVERGTNRPARVVRSDYRGMAPQLSQPDATPAPQSDAPYDESQYDGPSPIDSPPDGQYDDDSAPQEEVAGWGLFRVGPRTTPRGAGLRNLYARGR